jgi:hypothetical protein
MSHRAGHPPGRSKRFVQLMNARRATGYERDNLSFRPRPAAASDQQPYVTTARVIARSVSSCKAEGCIPFTSSTERVSATLFQMRTHNSLLELPGGDRLKTATTAPRNSIAATAQRDGARVPLRLSWSASSMIAGTPRPPELLAGAAASLGLPSPRRLRRSTVTNVRRRRRLRLRRAGRTSIIGRLRTGLGWVPQSWRSFSWPKDARQQWGRDGARPRGTPPKLFRRDQSDPLGTATIIARLFTTGVPPAIVAGKAVIARVAGTERSTFAHLAAHVVSGNRTETDLVSTPP